MKDDEFYNEVARLLNTSHEYYRHVDIRKGKTYRTRWNNRQPGNGRFPEFGLVRLFGDTVQIILRQPKEINATIEGRQAALDYLEMSLQ